MSYYETNLGHANTYYKVLEPFEVQELVRHEPSNYWYGASRIHTPVYKPLQVQPGGVILNTYGGIFYADKPGDICRPVVLHVNDKSPFEKRYMPDRHLWPLDKLEVTSEIKYVPWIVTR